MNSRKRSLYCKLTSIFVLLTFFVAIMPYLISGNHIAIPEIEEISQNKKIHADTNSTETIKVMTLNLAHGRGMDYNQLFVSQKKIYMNLNGISNVLLREQPQIAGFQEADGPSFWSGGMDHIKHIAGQSGLYSFIHGYHIKAPNLKYGTALASKWNIIEPAYVTFSPGPFAPPKGFSVGSFKWPGAELLIDVLVLHLDFISEAKRNSQIEEIKAFMETRENRPIILMGDFNSTWNNNDSSVKKICSVLNLKAYNPDEKNLSSFPFTDKRIDWILISNQLEFVSYRSLQDKISDHLAVVCEIKLLRK